MTWLVAVDPGIDATGVACFHLGSSLDNGYRAWRAGETFTQALKRLGPRTVIRTKPDEDLVERLILLGDGFGTFTEIPGGIEVILLERPAFAGAYAARRGRQRTKGMINGAAMEKLYLALGVLIDSAVSCSELRLGGRVLLVPAPRAPKKKRHELVVQTLHQQRHPLVEQGARRLSPDLLDAIYLGAAWLSDLRRVADVPNHQSEGH